MIERLTLQRATDADAKGFFELGKKLSSKTYFPITTIKGVAEEIREGIVYVIQKHPENAKAIGLYGSLGFTVSGIKENHFGDGEPRVVLTLER